MADEYLSAQDEQLGPVPEGFIVLVSNPADDHTYKTDIKNLKVYDRFFIKKPSGGFLQIEAADTDVLIITPIATLP
jgi:hypothetical protein